MGSSAKGICRAADDVIPLETDSSRQLNPLTSTRSSKKVKKGVRGIDLVHKANGEDPETPPAELKPDDPVALGQKYVRIGSQ